MFRIFLFFVFLISFLGCQNRGRTYLKKFPNGKTESEVFYPNSKDSTTCSIKMYYPSGQLFKQAEMLNGKYIGKKVSYYENGVIEQINLLSNPCDTSQNCDGVLTRYYNDGVKSGVYIIRNNLVNGIVVQYNRNGSLAKEYEIKDGVIKNGIYREFDGNGNKYFEGRFRNDTLVGMAYFFSEKGDSVKYYSNVNGDIDLPYKKWLNNGITITGFYSNDKKSIVWVWKDLQGRTIKQKKENSREDIVAPDE